MATVYSNIKAGQITDNPLSSGATTINSAAFADLPAVTGSDILWITLDPDAANGAPEIVKVTAHTAAATSVTVTRAQQSTSARSHPVNTVWKHAVTKTDLDAFLVSVATANIEADAVTNAKIADDQIDSEHYVAGSIDAEHLATDSVTTDKIADSNVTTAKIADANVTLAKMATNSVDSDQYVDGSIDTAHIADGQVTLAKLENDAWAAVTFQNSWTDTGGGTQPTQYRKVAGRVYVRLACSTGSSGTVAFTLPSGFRPAYLIRRPLDGAGAYAFAEIATTGTVTLTGVASIQGEFSFEAL